MSAGLTITIDYHTESTKTLKSFKAVFENETHRDAVLTKLKTVPLPPQLRIRTDHHENTDWAWEIGEFVPLRLITVDHPKYVALLTMEDQTYMKHYDDSIWLSDDYEVRQRTIGEYTGWALKKKHLLDAIDFHNEYTDLGIPQSNTLEWEAFHDESKGRVLFYPYFPNRIGEQKEGDTWAGMAKWDDTLRCFVFSEEDWDSYMTFHGFTY
jgi:hypothetical protein